MLKTLETSSCYLNNNQSKESPGAATFTPNITFKNSNLGCFHVLAIINSAALNIGVQPRCPSADEWIRKLWYIYTMEYYSAMKKNSFESVLMRWMKLEPIIQTETSQKDKDQYSVLMHIYGI